jgi:tetratricopeptide (TPR) repeat protein
MYRCLLLTLLLFSVFRLSSQDKPKKPHQLYEAAEAEIAKGNFTSALQLLDECLKNNPGFVEAYPMRGGVREQVNDLEGALTDYSIYLEKFPLHADVMMSRAVVRYKIGFYQQAKEDFTALLSAESGETTAIFYKQNMSVGDRNPMVTTTQRRHNPYVFNYLGLIEYKQNNPAGAIPYYDTAISIEPSEPDFFVNRGLARESLNDSTAFVDFEIALRLNPDHTLARHNLEASKAKSIRKLSPEERLSKTIEADSTMLYPYLERAQQRFEGGFFDGALEDYNQAAKLAPDNYEIFFARGLTKEKLKNYDGAFSDYTKAIDIRENYPKAWLGRGNVLLKMERYTDAIEDYNTALIYQSDYAPAYYNRGVAKLKLKQNAEACADLKQAESLGMKVDEKLRKRACNQ